MTNRDRTMIMVVALFAVLGAFWFLVLSPKRDDVASLKDEVTSAQTRLDTANAAATTAESAKAKYADDYRTVASLGKAVPADDDVPSLVFQLQQATKASKIDFNSIMLTGTSTAAAAPAVAPPVAQVGALANEQNGNTTSTGATTPTTPTAPATGTAGTGTAGTGTAPAASAAGAPAAGATPGAVAPAAPAAQTLFAGLPPGATVGPAGLPTMPFTFEFTGPFQRLESLLERIDAFTKTSGGKITVNGRLMTIDSISLTGFPEITATVSATAFVLPDDQGLLAGATPSAPGAVPVAAAAPTAASPTGSGPVTPVATATPAAGVGK